jgi:hypothetical protein
MQFSYYIFNLRDSEDLGIKFYKLLQTLHILFNIFFI